MYFQYKSVLKCLFKYTFQRPVEELTTFFFLWSHTFRFLKMNFFTFWGPFRFKHLWVSPVNFPLLGIRECISIFTVCLISMETATSALKPLIFNLKMYYKMHSAFLLDVYIKIMCNSAKQPWVFLFHNWNNHLLVKVCDCV